MFNLGERPVSVPRGYLEGHGWLRHMGKSCLSHPCSLLSRLEPSPQALLTLSILCLLVYSVFCWVTTPWGIWEKMNEKHIYSQTIQIASISEYFWDCKKLHIPVLCVRIPKRPGNQQKSSRRFGDNDKARHTWCHSSVSLHFHCLWKQQLYIFKYWLWSKKSYRQGALR